MQQKNPFTSISSFRTSWQRHSKEKKEACWKMLSSELGLISQGGFISFPFGSCRHLRFPMTSTNFTLFFWFPLGCSSLYAFPLKSAFWQFFLLTHPAVSSVFVCHLIFPFEWPTHTLISQSIIHFVVKAYCSVIVSGQFKVTCHSKETRDPRKMLSQLQFLGSLRVYC